MNHNIKSISGGCIIHGMNLDGDKVITRCPDCKGALTNFLFKDSSGSAHGKVSRIKQKWIQGINYDKIEYVLAKCAGCGRGGLAIIYVRIEPYKTCFAGFYPRLLNQLKLPDGVPSGVASEFEEAEICASVAAYRAGSAMLRSTLEKTLNDHGYTEQQLSTNLKNLGEDGVIPIPIKEKATSIVKILGDEVLHHEWREVSDEEFENAHEYTQRILDAFYNEEESVKKILIQKGRLTKKATEELNAQKDPEEEN